MKDGLLRATLCSLTVLFSPRSGSLLLSTAAQAESQPSIDC